MNRFPDNEKGLKTNPLPCMPIDKKTRGNAMLNKHFPSFISSKCLDDPFGTKCKPLNLGGNKVKTSRLLRKKIVVSSNLVKTMMVNT